MSLLDKTLPGEIISGQKKIIFNAGVEAYKEYNDPKQCFSHKIQLLFSPFGAPFVPIEIIGDDTGKIIRDFTWTKDRNNPGGILQCTLTPDVSFMEKTVKTLDKVSGGVYSKIWGALGVELEDLLKPMTLCQLWIDGFHVCIGYVRSCKRSSSISESGKDVSYSVVIEELGNIYNLSTTSLDLNLQDLFQVQILDSVQKALGLSAQLKGCTVATGIKAILDTFAANTLLNGITMSDGFPLGYRLQARPNPIGGIANTPICQFMTYDSNMYQLNSAGGSQSVWSLIQSFVPSPWNELFTESGGRTMVTDGLGAPSVLFPGFSYPVVRTAPYSNVLLGTVNPKYFTQTLPFEINALQMVAGGDFVIITDEMIQDKTIGVDSINQYTVFHTTYGNRSTGAEPDSNDRAIKCPGPLNPFASGGIPTFGIREMFQQIDCTSFKGLGTAPSYIERIAKNIGLFGTALSKAHLSNLLALWFRNQSRFREGTVTTRGIPYARAGMYCLYLPPLSGKRVDNARDIAIYYIDSVSHSYQLENETMQFTTTLNLIRGVPLPGNIGTTLLLLFDFETFPPESGIVDGEYQALKTVRDALKKVRGGVTIS